jgi:hypothetical protein
VARTDQCAPPARPRPRPRGARFPWVLAARTPLEEGGREGGTRTDLDAGDAEAAGLEHDADAAGGDALAEPADDAARDDDVLGRHRLRLVLRHGETKRSAGDWTKPREEEMSRGMRRREGRFSCFRERKTAALADASPAAYVYSTRGLALGSNGPGPQLFWAISWFVKFE